MKVITSFFVMECNQHARLINAKDDGIESQTNRRIETYLAKPRYGMVLIG